MGCAHIRSLNTKTPRIPRCMRLNGLGALNKIEPGPTKPENKPKENSTQNSKKGYCFYCNKFGHFKAECRKMKRAKWLQIRKHNGPNNNSAGSTLKCDTCGEHHKTKDCWNGANAANDPRPKRHNQQKRKTAYSVQRTATKTVDESKNSSRRICASGKQ